MICEFQKQHELDYADRRKTMNEKNAFFSFIDFLLPCTALGPYR
jgi:hypothetical protein